MKSSFYYYVLIFSLFTAKWCTGQPSDSDGFRELPSQQERNFRSLYSSSGALGNIPDIPSSSSTTEMPQLTGSDISQLSDDKLGLEAIRSLHRQLDDDANGNVDLSESDEFLREELKYEDGHERRQRAFHRNDDMHISVRELWEAWVRSEVHNWTVEQTTEWLTTSVELPQYVPNFIMHKVTGSKLPRLAVNNMQYLVNTLGIKDPIHKQKIALKAMDVVLFGPPKDGGHIKDLILMTLLMGALGACWYAYRQKILSQEDLQRMIKDMESLHMAEQKLILTQKQLEQARQEQECVVSEKESLERKLMERATSPSGQHHKISDMEVIQLKAEIENLRLELRRAEGELVDRCWSPPSGLQQWLQLTHEIENKAYIKKKTSAEKQLQQAREACEKLKKKRSSLVGAFVSTHGKSIDDVDRSIVEARTSLNEVTQELQERVHRWKQIEMLCGFNIVNNSGLPFLENMLYRQTNGRLGSSVRGRMNSQDDLDDDSVSQFSPGGKTTTSTSHTDDQDSEDQRLIGGLFSGGSDMMEGLPWRDGTADSSGSEAGRDDLLDSLLQDNISTPSSVLFTLGGDMSPIDEQSVLETKVLPSPLVETKPPLPAPVVAAIEAKRGSVISRSVSQEAHCSFVERVEREVTPPKVCQSEPCLDASAAAVALQTAQGARSKKTAEQSSGASGVSLEEDTYSTDSSTTAVTEEEMKRKRRKLHFPTFTRKSKSKAS